MEKKFISGLWWPSTDRHAHMVLPQEAREAIPRVLKHLKARRLCLQAGGNAGAYPIMLSGFFDKVITFEPEPENFECLKKNNLQGNLEIRQEALGDREDKVGIWVNKVNMGECRITGRGDILMTKIDLLDLKVCDLIWLDIEGYELPALKGAEETIKKFGPLIVVENNQEPETGKWLSQFGYQNSEIISRDIIYAR